MTQRGADKHTGTAGTSAADRRATTIGPAIDLLTSKLSAPRSRLNTVSRPRLIKRLRDAEGAPIVTVVAPAGYGKTTLLAEWAEQNGTAFAWVSVDEQDNDPKLLLTYIAAALDGVTPIDPAVFDALSSPGSSVAGVVTPRLCRAFASMPRPVVLVLDDVHVVHNRECQAAITALTDAVPPGSRLAIAARHEPPIRLARLRAADRVLEIGPEDLTLDADAAGVLLRDAGAELSDSDVTVLHEKTEGWPVALYLAALAIRSGSSVRTTAAAFGGDDLFVSDYVSFEILSSLPAKEIQFLKQSAVLNRMSGPLCDEALQTRGAAELLARMQRSNQLIVPLDHHGEWFRYHHLFREMLLAELERSEPDRATEIRRRASAWFEQRGDLEAALEYSMAAGDEDSAARLIGALAIPVHRVGRISTLDIWCGWLRDRGRLDRYPFVTVLAAWVYALMGNAAEAEWWAEDAERETPAADEDPMTAGLRLILQTVMCRHGVETMMAGAEASVQGFGRVLGTPYLLKGIALILAGDPETADRVLEESVEVNREIGATLDQVLSWAERSVLAIQRGDWDDAGRYAREARSVSRESHLEEYPISALAYGASAHVAVHDGDVEAARRYLVHAQRLRGNLTYALPHIAVQARLELARAYLGLGEVAGARTLLREIDGLLRRRPGLGTLVDETEALRGQLALQTGAAAGGFQTLTAAELRLLPLLSTHFSFREIGETLYVSPHTVKSQACSIYRKLGVSSRSEAIRSARDIGLLEG